MRLFIAINFEESTKNQINEIITYLQPKIKRGRFVNPENLHLTLEFLGEIKEDKMSEIEEVMSTLAFPEFTLSLTELSYFKTRKGRLYWLGMEENDTLQQLQYELHQKLLEANFKLESRPFLPHITIGRNIKVKQKLNHYEIEKRLKLIEIKVDTIDLMASSIIDGKLTYTLIASKPLTE